MDRVAFPSRLPSGYGLYAHGADLILRYGSEDDVFCWYAVLPVRDPVHGVNVAMEVDERIQEHRERRNRQADALATIVAGTTVAGTATEDFRYQDFRYPWHPWGGMERGA